MADKSNAPNIATRASRRTSIIAKGSCRQPILSSISVVDAYKAETHVARLGMCVQGCSKTPMTRNGDLWSRWTLPGSKG